MTILSRSGRRCLALAVAALCCASCGGPSETADGSAGGGEPGPGLSGAVPRALFGGAGDQLAPSVRGGLVAFVDYSEDSNGACRVEVDDVDCAGILRVVRLEGGTTVAQVRVGAALPALGDGFVAWTELPDGSSGDWYGHVRVLDLVSGEQRELTEPQMQVDLSGPPAIDGKLVAFLDSSWQEPGVRLHDLAAGTSSTVTLQTSNGPAPVALAGGRLAFLDRDTSSWTAMVTVVELATGRRVRVDPEPGLPAQELFQPALGDGLVAVKQGNPWSCYDATGASCQNAVVVQDLVTGERFVHGGATISRFGPLLLAAGSVLWLDGRDGPYAFFGVAFGGSEERRVTPAGAQLSYSAPGSARDGQLVWADRSSGDFDVYGGALELR